MANKPGHRRFGNVRARASGRWQARYLGPDGRLRSAPMTFGSRKDAERWLTLVESQMIRGEWFDPQRAVIAFGVYAARWITERPSLRPRTVELYRWLLSKHIEPHLGGVSLGDISTALVREWRSNLLAAGVSQSMARRLTGCFGQCSTRPCRRTASSLATPAGFEVPTGRTRAKGRSSQSLRSLIWPTPCAIAGSAR